MHRNSITALFQTNEENGDMLKNSVSETNKFYREIRTDIVLILFGLCGGLLATNFDIFGIAKKFEDWIAFGSYTLVIIFASWPVLFIVNLILIRFRGSKEINDEETTFMQNSKKRQRLERDLRDLASEHTMARIHILKSEYHSMAEMLNSIFALAKWKTKGIPPAPEARFITRHIYGTEVRGYNKHLVDGVVEALTKTGMKDVSANLQPLKDKPSNPDYFVITSSLIKITIGYQK